MEPLLCILLLYLSSAYTSIGAREIDGLPKAFMAELLITKQDPNSCDRSGKSPTKLEAMSPNY